MKTKRVLALRFSERGHFQIIRLLISLKNYNVSGTLENISLHRFSIVPSL
jgi:hypothetical protein